MALLPPGYLKSVVSIEDYEDGNLKTIGTGFIYAKVLEKKGDQFRAMNYLVTAKHVLYKAGLSRGKQRQKVFLRFDSLGENVQVFELSLYVDGLAVFSSTLGECDVAVIPINGNILKEAGIDYVQIIDTDTALHSNKYEEAGVSNGDGVFYLGFPLGLKGAEKNYAMCRSGSIARVDDETLSNNLIYLDAPVFPGNSGGPVFIKPQFVAIEGTVPVKKAYLLGIVISFLSMGEERDALTNKQVQILEGHLGLSKIVTVDAIDEAIQESERRVIENGS
ncbi:trypsin-like peptidase domain-containing protein [Candidatus Uhrbacteria bacterium]|jgi:hypothetical protein|nr:trypsin-like peptidase domain-containing protein [Candidatus Uhrbacteria bacterium]MBT7716801.1 trypsin-like peptidase domain-containing protein [Candidatus Uhrbacteria bacterium]